MSRRFNPFLFWLMKLETWKPWTFRLFRMSVVFRGIELSRNQAIMMSNFGRVTSLVGPAILVCDWFSVKETIIDYNWTHDLKHKKCANNTTATTMIQLVPNRIECRFVPSYSKIDIFAFVFTRAIVESNQSFLAR